MLSNRIEYESSFLSQEPNTPYPTMVFANDLIKIYVDFVPITTTTSPDDAVALLLSMYTLFELNFPKNGRTIRLLYSVLHSDKQYLTNTIRSFMRENEIHMVDESSRNQSLAPTLEKRSLPTDIHGSQSMAEHDKTIDAAIKDPLPDQDRTPSDLSNVVSDLPMNSSEPADR